MGYAERNPEADVEGYDACRKIAILSSLMCGKNVNFANIYTEGITKITSADFAYAKEMGKSIKLLAMSKAVGDGYLAMVSPCMISREHPLYMVNDVFNAVFVHSNMLGDSMYYGKGAGKLPTASAVVGDVIDCARSLGTTLKCFWDAEDAKLVSKDELARKFFVRVSTSADAKVKEIFGNVEVLKVEGLDNEFGFVTEVMTEKAFEEKLAAVDGVITRIRIEE